jgi:hypothetical protein
MCLPWCAPGLQLGFADENTEAYLLWLEQMKGAELDLTFVENSPKMPLEHFSTAMEPRNTVLHATFGPEDHGQSDNTLITGDMSMRMGL